MQTRPEHRNQNHFVCEVAVLFVPSTLLKGTGLPTLARCIRMSRAGEEKTLLVSSH
ncbi:MAG: hypothetical protein AVDCRST_MAG93-5814 [uncultured Chloroflexia bacterium]|uniref:Uncharacterized protein n=1 Tax=uncultured Chloroflexia bacterium TaxID=1672391 RepID=A0A6J4L5B3_9CHLR|nr:MAG: hypothetical protein AVDCRST_MAG93-5814 [uncultured Chloroflexia bacterium]